MIGCSSPGTKLTSMKVGVWGSRVSQCLGLCIPHRSTWNEVPPLLPNQPTHTPGGSIGWVALLPEFLSSTWRPEQSSWLLALSWLSALAIAGILRINQHINERHPLPFCHFTFQTKCNLNVKVCFKWTVLEVGNWHSNYNSVWCLPWCLSLSPDSASSLTFLIIYTVGGSSWWLKCVGLCYPAARRKWNSSTLVSVYPKPG